MHTYGQNYDFKVRRDNKKNPMRAESVDGSVDDRSVSWAISKNDKKLIQKSVKEKNQICLTLCCISVTIVYILSKFWF